MCRRALRAATRTPRTAVGLHRYYDTVGALPDQSNVTALVDAGLVQVQTVLGGGALAAAVASVVSVGALRMRDGDPVDAETQG